MVEWIICILGFFFSQYLFFQLLFQLIFHREASDSPCLAPAYSVQDKNIKVMLKEGISSENDARNSLWVPYVGSLYFCKLFSFLLWYRPFLLHRNFAFLIEIMVQHQLI